MPDLAIPYRVDAALERGIEGRGVSREDALSLIVGIPFRGPARNRRSHSGPVERPRSQLFQEKSSFRLPIFAAIIADIALSGLTRKQVYRPI